MKRRNREQRARMRTIQEAKLTKPFQRTMDFLCRKYGWSYRDVYQEYQMYQKRKAAREFTVEIRNPTVVTREENGICMIDITGQVPFRDGELTISVQTANGEELEP